jgi:hypothetical protein
MTVLHTCREPQCKRHCCTWHAAAPVQASNEGALPIAEGAQSLSEAAVEPAPCPKPADTPQVCLACSRCMSDSSFLGHSIAEHADLPSLFRREKHWSARHSVCNLPSFARPHARQLGRLWLRDILATHPGLSARSYYPSAWLTWKGCLWMVRSRGGHGLSTRAQIR